MSLTLARLLTKLRFTAGAAGTINKRDTRARARLTLNHLLVQCISAMTFIPFARQLKYRIEAKIIASTCPYLFDEEFYLERNPDVRTYKNSALTHFLKYGGVEGRDPHPLFMIDYYVYNSRIAPRSINPLTHYCLVGRLKNQSPTRWFNHDYYLKVNHDVRNGKIEAFEHFAKFGVHENRKSSPLFDAPAYVVRYTDVRELKIPALFHYVNFGMREDRVGLFKSSDSIDALKTSQHEEKIIKDDEAKHILQEILEMEPNTSPNVVEVDVIIPVYRDFYITMRCLYSALKMRNKLDFEVVVIDDNSPEPEINVALNRIADKGLITLISHDVNCGFVISVNEGMQLHPDRDVILLNSDAEVYGNWIDRLSSIAYAESNISTVCPLTNSGTICSYPYFLKDNDVPSDCSMEELDKIAARVNQGQYVPAPTSVGFCMFIKRAAINQVGYFDEAAFGTGYGEENDFCLRAQEAGWKDVIAMDTVVHHWGSASFQGEKVARVENALRIIGQRYPSYNKDVQTYIAIDPAKPYRGRIDHDRLIRLKAAKNILVVSHRRGGGTEQHIQERAQRYKAKGWSFFRLFGDDINRRLVYLVHNDAFSLPNGSTYDLGCDSHLNELAQELGTLSIDEIEVHNLADFWSDACSAFVKLAEISNIPFRFFVHDYLSICPRINLCDNDGFYCGEPSENECNRCLRSYGSDYGLTDIQDWRQQYGVFLRAAREIIAPNSDVRDRLHRYFPELKIDVEEHENVQQAAYRPRTRLRGDVFRIGTIGAISHIKGLDVLRDCARYAASKKMGVKFVVVGFTSDDLISEKAGLEITGAYANDRAMEEVEKANLDALFLPATWPETFSYTLSIALRTGLPVFAFNLGAIADRLGKVERKLLIDLKLAKSPDKLVNLLYKSMEKNQFTKVSPSGKGNEQ